MPSTEAAPEHRGWNRGGTFHHKPLPATRHPVDPSPTAGGPTAACPVPFSQSDDAMLERFVDVHALAGRCLASREIRGRRKLSSCGRLVGFFKLSTLRCTRRICVQPVCLPLQVTSPRGRCLVMPVISEATSMRECMTMWASKWHRIPLSLGR